MTFFLSQAAPPIVGILYALIDLDIYSSLVTEANYHMSHSSGGGVETERNQ